MIVALYVIGLLAAVIAATAPSEGNANQQGATAVESTGAPVAGNN